MELARAEEHKGQAPAIRRYVNEERARRSSRGGGQEKESGHAESTQRDETWRRRDRADPVRGGIVRTAARPRRRDGDAPERGGARQQRPRPGARDCASHDPQVPDPVAALLHLRAEADAQRARAGHAQGLHRPDREVQRAAAALGVSVDAAVRLRRRRVREVRRERAAGAGDRADRAGAVRAHLARTEVRADAPGPRHHPLSQRAGRRPPRACRSDARLGEPQQLPQADAAVRAVPARVPAGAVADHAHHAQPRHRGGPVVRRHARHLVHDQRHRRSGVRVQ